MHPSLENKVALITGSGRGIGAETAREFSRRGARVAIHYRSSTASAEKLAEEIHRAGGDAQVFGADLDDESAIPALVAKVVRVFGRIDILVNNAGAFVGEDHLTSASAIAQFRTNAIAPALLIQATRPHFPASGGRVINVSSISSAEATPTGPVYAATKAALESFTLTYAKILGGAGITVNAVSPGTTNTPENDWLDDARRKLIREQTSLARVGEAVDIARAIALLASDDAGWITGQIIRVDGGYSVGRR